MNNPSPAHALTAIEALLDQVDATHATPGDRLNCAQQARRLASRLTALAGLLLAHADATHDTMRHTGTPTSTWLTLHGGLSKREAAHLLHQARDLTRHPDIGHAALTGRITINQARAIHTVLDRLPDLTNQQQTHATHLMVNLADTLDSDQLAKTAPRSWPPSPPTKPPTPTNTNSNATPKPPAATDP